MIVRIAWILLILVLLLAANLKLIPLGSESGPEHVVLARDGKLYAAMTSGNIMCTSPDGNGQDVFVHTGGRVLGFDFYAAGRLIAADAVKGLLAVTPQRKVTPLATASIGCMGSRLVPAAAQRGS